MSGSLPSLLPQRAEQLGPAKQGAKQMSPHVGNFVQDLVEMAKATEELPKVQEELSDARIRLDRLSGTIMDREASILRYKEEIEALHSTIRSLEVARDDAELRFLESDDRMLKLERSFQRALEAMDETDKLIQSFKPVEPIHEAASEVMKAHAQSTPVVIEDRAEGQSESPLPQSESISPNSEGQSLASGQSEADPTVQEQSSDNGSDVQSSTVLTENVSQLPMTDTWPSSEPASDPSPGPYFGKRYRDVPGYIPLHEWLDGGGTKEDYYAPRSIQGW